MPTSAGKRAGIPWSKDPRLDVVILHWLEGHEEERLVLLGVKRTPGICKRDCAKEIGNAIIQTGIIPQQDEITLYNRVNKRIARLRQQHTDILCGFPLTFASKSYEEMKEEDEFLFERLVNLTQKLDNWPRWHEIFRKVESIKVEVGDSSDESHLSEVDDRSTERGLTPPSTRETPAQPRRRLRSARNARESTATLPSGSKSRPVVDDGDLENEEEDIHPETRNKRRHRVETFVSAERTTNKRVRLSSTPPTSPRPRQSSVKRNSISEGRRELYNLEKLQLRKLELEMDERRRREEHERERERERFEVVLKFL